MMRDHAPYAAEFRAQRAGLVMKAGRGVDSSGVRLSAAAASLLRLSY